MISAMFSILLLVALSLGWSQEYALDPMDKVILVLSSAQVSMGPPPANLSPRVRLTVPSGVDVTSRMEGATLRVTASPGKVTAPVKVEILGDKPLEVHLVDGQVSLGKTSAPVVAEIQRGRFAAKDSKSAIRISQLAGTIQISGQQNRLEIDLLKGDLSVKGMSGDLFLVGQNMDASIEKFTGASVLKQHQGSTKFVESGGSVQFEATSASLQFAKFKGRVEGVNTEGSVALTAAPEADASLRSVSGKLNISGGGTSAFVALLATEGELTSSTSLRVGKLKTGKVVRGRLGGAQPGGRIEASTESGVISLRE